MKRKCDRCDNEATVHEVVIRNGEKAEKHVCEGCAREDGFTVHAHAPISDLITKFVISQTKGEKSPVKVGVCGSCGLTFAEFKQQGVLGCPECYQTFEEQLSAMIERAHEGATHHIGKSPKRAGGSAGRHERITTLRKQLHDAITAEQYERAAALRDQLLRVEKPAAEREAAAESSKPQRGRGGSKA